MNTDLSVPIRADVPGSLYRPLAKIAEQHGLDVGGLLVQLGREFAAGLPAVGPREPRQRFHWSPERRERLIWMRNQGLSSTQIAEELGCTPDLVRSETRNLRKADITRAILTEESTR
jgi:hypothetical protein